jgi:hypothetical protein
MVVEYHTETRRNNEGDEKSDNTNGVYPVDNCCVLLWVGKVDNIVFRRCHPHLPAVDYGEHLDPVAKLTNR